MIERIDIQRAFGISMLVMKVSGEDEWLTVQEISDEAMKDLARRMRPEILREIAGEAQIKVTRTGVTIHELIVDPQRHSAAINIEPGLSVHYSPYTGFGDGYQVKEEADDSTPDTN